VRPETASNSRQGETENHEQVNEGDEKSLACFIKREETIKPRAWSVQRERNREGVRREKTGFRLEETRTSEQVDKRRRVGVQVQLSGVLRIFQVLTKIGRNHYFSGNFLDA